MITRLLATALEIPVLEALLANQNHKQTKNGSRDGMKVDREQRHG